MNNLYLITALYKHVITFVIFSAPPSRVEINTLPATKTQAPPPWKLNGATTHAPSPNPFSVTSSNIASICNSPNQDR